MMSKKLWCDICKIELGTEHIKNTILDEWNKPCWNDFYKSNKSNSNERNIIDVCNDCEQELVNAVAAKIKELKEVKKCVMK